MFYINIHTLAVGALGGPDLVNILSSSEEKLLRKVRLGGLGCTGKGILWKFMEGMLVWKE